MIDRFIDVSRAEEVILVSISGVDLFSTNSVVSAAYDKCILALRLLSSESVELQWRCR